MGQWCHSTWCHHKVIWSSIWRQLESSGCHSQHPWVIGSWWLYTMAIQTGHTREYARHAEVHCWNIWVLSYNQISVWGIWSWLHTTSVCPRSWPSHRHLPSWAVLKRVATCTRNGNNADINSEAFVEAMRSPNTGLTYTALPGKRKQSVVDAEKLLSYNVAEFFRQKGYCKEYEYVKVIAQWHEASDGRGISQLQRCRYNHEMLGYILDEWMPWHRENYDFSTIDINRYII